MTQTFEAPILVRKHSDNNLASLKTLAQTDQPRSLSVIAKRLLKELTAFVETVRGFRTRQSLV
jgi:hypothetical protein